MITSISNAGIRRIKDYLCKKKARDRDSCFVAEGLRLVLEVPAERILSIFISESFEKKADDDLRRFLNAHASHTEIVDDIVFRKLSDTETPQGILAVVKKINFSLEDVIRGRLPASSDRCTTKPYASTSDLISSAESERYMSMPPLLLILDGLQDPGNLGTILRSAEAAGATGILLCEGTVDIYSPKVVRSTMGSIFRLPFAQIGDLREAVTIMKKHGIKTAAADMAGNITYDAFDSAGPVAFIIGNEGNGLSELAKTLTDTFVSIPMAGKTESLNAAVCASLLLFDAARKRRS